MATFCSESSVGGLPFPEAHRLCLVSWEHATAPRLAKLKKGAAVLSGMETLTPGAVHIFRVAVLSVLSCPLLRDWYPSARRC